ncbi:TonB-dependent receptor [Pseudomaricurvus alkylphenolicus]|uniref:TonB-dependent receptor n=1 Tax=Pseudomaricurvus alkylphenolicus TaxID=1306991 RepID=UPI0014209AC3|nr:TonB-dependent receptor [Pseudomaricurvus alkylphenolicus]NIB43663.1 TonB-dependent receptor [Pseudomaricurvus alkylphenolicus]
MNNNSKVLLKRNLLSLAMTAGMLSTDLQAGVLEEVVVTAQKREQSAQDVGIAITAFSGDQMKSLGFEQSVDVAKFTPSVSVSGSFAGQMSQFSIRGVTQNDFNDHVEAPIAVYIDEGYVAMQQGQMFSTFDVDRVEALKGPQGTLFGRNATGGLIHFISNRPTEDFEAYADLSYGAYNHLRFEGAVSGAIADGVNGRLSGMYNRYSEVMDNHYPNNTYVPEGLNPPLNNGLDQPEGAGDDLMNDSTWALRAQLQFELSDTSELLLTAFGSETDTSVGAYQSAQTIAVLDANGEQVNSFYVSADETREMIGPNGEGLDSSWDSDSDGVRPRAGGDFYGYIDPDGNDFDTSSDFAFDNLNSFETYGLNAKLSIDFDTMTFVAITDYKDYDKFVALDLEGSPADQFIWLQEAQEKTLTQEFRLNGDTESTKWVAGFYYLYIDNDNISGLSALPSSSTGFNFDQPRIASLKTESYSLFGQMEFDISDTLTLVGGLRATVESKEYDFEVLFSAPNLNPKRWDFANPVDLSSIGFSRGPFHDNTRDTLWTGKLQLDWKPTDDWLVYAGVNRGVKAGSFNAGGGDITDDVIPYDEEVLTSYELGFKSTLLEGLARLNGAVYYYDYQDYQAARWLGFANQITNNDATTRGAELELVVTPIENLDLMLNLGYFDATVKDVAITSTLSKDVTPAFAPEKTASALVRYQLPVDVFDGSLALQGDITYQSETYHNLTNFDSTRMDAYALVNLRASWASADDAWQVDAYVKNVNDKRYNTVGFDLSQVCGCNEEAQGKPRWWGVSVRYNYD